MENFIPNDFFTNNKNTVYSDEKTCLEKEGSAIGFDPIKINLSESKIDSGVIIPDQDKAAINLKDEQIKELYKVMVADIYAQMKIVFGTSNDASAAAFASTYEAMAIRPANYINPILGLTDEASVLSYANGKIATADAYAVFRLNRIAQFESDKNAILNP